MASRHELQKTIDTQRETIEKYEKKLKGKKSLLILSAKFDLFRFIVQMSSRLTRVFWWKNLPWRKVYKSLALLKSQTQPMLQLQLIQKI